MVDYRKDGVGNDADGCRYVTHTLGDGLGIWHVDAHLAQDGQDFMFNNWSAPHKLLRLMEADGLEEIEQLIHWGHATAADYYTPGKVFGPASFPNSSDYSGHATAIYIDSIIRSPAGSISARYAIGEKGQPVLTARASVKKLRPRQRFTIRGKLLIGPIQAPLADAAITVYSSKNKISWKTAGSTTAGSGGQFGRALQAPQKGVRYYQVRSAESGNYLGALSKIIKTTVQSTSRLHLKDGGRRSLAPAGAPPGGKHAAKITSGAPRSIVRASPRRTAAEPCQQCSAKQEIFRRWQS